MSALDNSNITEFGQSNKLAQDFGVLSLLRFALPTIAMMVFMGLYTIVDTIFISRFVNTDALSSINIVTPLLNITVVFIEEIRHLNPVPTLSAPVMPKTAAVRKTNVVHYLQNRYEVPKGTYFPGRMARIEADTQTGRFTVCILGLKPSPSGEDFSSTFAPSTGKTEWLPCAVSQAEN